MQKKTMDIPRRTSLEGRAPQQPATVDGKAGDALANTALVPRPALAGLRGSFISMTFYSRHSIQRFSVGTSEISPPGRMKQTVFFEKTPNQCYV